MTTINLLIALFLAATAFAALASLAHSLLATWKTAQELTAMISHLPDERVGVTWHDFPARVEASVVQLRPALRRYVVPATILPEFRAAA